MALRQAAKAKPPVSGGVPARTPSESSPESVSIFKLVSQLPSHLGWGSEAASKTIRTALHRRVLAATEVKADQPISLPMSDESHWAGQPLGVHESTSAGTQLRLSVDGDTIKHYPAIGIGALKEEQATLYRVWLACRYLDGAGSGWVSLIQMRAEFASHRSKLRLCGWRRLRQILGKGNGRFWDWDKARGRVWLFGAARVAAHLGVSRLAGQPVALPMTAITEGIGDFKAHLYAAWHSGRHTDNPISRSQQHLITSVPERTQRHYGKVARIGRQTNMAIGGKYTSEEVKKQAWQRGRAVFQFTDHQGQQGRKGASYVAWHLPNSYIGPHSGTAKGRQRKINRELKDLVDKEAQGNGGKRLRKCYYANGGEAGQAYNRQSACDLYWPFVGQKGRHRVNLWACFFIS